MLKVLTLVGTRPELIKMSRVISELDSHTDHILVHSGQNYDYELNQVFFDDLEIRKPDYFLGASGDNSAQMIADIISKADEVFENEMPDAVLLYGDTNSCLSVLSAKRRKIPVFHMEAGNRCFDQRVPEELNRKVLDHLSDINMVLTEHARRYLLAEGISPERVIKTGSHMEEVLDYYADRISASSALEIERLNKKQYFIVSAHREENVDSKAHLSALIETLETLVKEFGFPVVVSTHPRTKKRLEELGHVENNPMIRFLKPFGFFDYIKLQLNSFCVISDSGTITEESSLLNFPAVTIRDAHERPEGMDVGTLIMCPLHSGRIIDSVKIVTSDDHTGERVIPVVDDYLGGPVSKQVLRVVHSYTDYVNRVVWNKN